MEITINELYKGLPCIIKNKEFKSSEEYVKPFLDQMSKYTEDFRVSAKLASALSTTNDRTNRVYSRVLIEAVMPESHCVDNHDEVIGFLYGLDISKPVAKIYKSHLNRACTNMCVFSPEWLQIQELKPNEAINYSGIQNLMELTNDFKVKLEATKKIFISREDRKLELGNWVDSALRESIDLGYGKVKITPALPISAYKKLFIDQKSEYYIPEGHDPSQFDVLNAFTQVVTDGRKSDIMNMFEKTQVINNILKIN